MSIELGEKIKAARKAKGISQQELASHLGISRATLSKYENGIHAPGALVLLELERILDIHDLQDELPLQNRLLIVKQPTASQTPINNDAISVMVEQVVAKALDSLTSTPTVTDSQLIELYSAFNRLNSLGKETAIQRVLELTEIPRYQGDNDDS